MNRGLSGQWSVFHVLVTKSVHEQLIENTIPTTWTHVHAVKRIFTQSSSKNKHTVEYHIAVKNESTKT